MENSALEFGKELSAMMILFPQTEVYTALRLARIRLNQGDLVAAAYNLRSDWDKYGMNYSWSGVLKSLVIKYGMAEKTDDLGYGLKWIMG